MKLYKNITLLLSLFLLGSCINGQNLKLYKKPPKKGLTNIQTIEVKNLDLDLYGYYAISGDYFGRNGSGLLAGFYAENKVEGDILTVTLFPVFNPGFGKMPRVRLVFAFQGYIENSYKYKKITLKLFDTEKTITN